MNTFLLNYIKRDNWLENGQNFGVYLKEIEKAKETISHLKAKKLVKRYLWKALKHA